MAVRRYWVYLALFLVSLALFFAGAAVGNAPLILVGIVATVVLFVLRRSFIPVPDEAVPGKRGPKQRGKSGLGKMR